MRVSIVPPPTTQAQESETRYLFPVCLVVSLNRRKNDDEKIDRINVAVEPRYRGRLYD